MKLQRSSGVLVHPTSFPSPYGIGDLGESAFKFIDFLQSTNQKLWQILPLGPTSYGDSPYQSFSTFAGNTLLISLDVLVKEGYLSSSDLDHIPNFDMQKVDYGDVIEFKKPLFKKAYDKFKGSATSKQKKNYKNFCDKSDFWLRDYTLFISLKQYFIKIRRFAGKNEEYNEFFSRYSKLMEQNSIDDCYFGAVWNSWPRDVKNRDENSLEYWSKELAYDIELEKFLQYEFFRQWHDLKDYANKRDIKVIGDIPIFVSPDSSDTWSHKELFFLDKEGTPTVVAGVPPDYFSEDGQLWGNPLYDWKANKKENYAWWVSRVAETLKIVDIVRIDHFRGFESYWAVKFGEKTAKQGKWEKGVGKELFDVLENQLGTLNIIAEDLGVITDEVIELRDSCALPGMKILQFAFGGDSRNLYLPHNIDTTNSVIYTGTHDNDTTIGWYKTASDKAKDQLRRYMNSPVDNPAWDLMRLAYSSTCAYCIIPLQDIMELGEDCRMNTPGVGAGNWQFRYTAQMLEVLQIKERLLYLTEFYNR